MSVRLQSSLQADTQAVLLATGITLVSIGLFVLLAWGQQVHILLYLYPVAVLAAGGFFYTTRPSLYVSFALWIWFLTPFVRRVLDYQMGVHSSVSLVMLTPYLLSAYSFFTFLRYGKYLRLRSFFPFTLAMLGVLYGYVIGIIKSGFFSPTFDLLEWMLPILFGFHLAVYWREYPALRAIVRKTFIWGVLVMGTYGLIQYVYPPAWDMFWLVQSGMTSSMGRPEAFSFRVFSTLNSTGPFAMVLMAGLLILFDGSGPLARVAAVPGYVSFLLTLVRGAWGGWALGLGFLILRLRNQLRMRLIVILGVGIVLSLPLLLYPPIAQRVGGRVNTLSNIEQDNSLRARQGLYRSATGRALLNPIGEGLGSLGRAAKLSEGQTNTFDSGVLAIPMTLGWPGTLLYGWGLYLLVRSLFGIREERTDQFAVVAAGIALSYIVLLLFANQMLGLKGVIVWSFISLAIIAQWFHDDARYNPRY